MFKAVIGLQFGDEGKGKFVDLLAQRYKHIARFNGGTNAGHTVSFNGKRTVFSQIPATVIDGKHLYVCQGALICMEKMIEELAFLREYCPNSKVFIDPRCHITLPIHIELNKASEAYKGKNKIGSVGVGVGACFEDKTNRTGIRLIDTMDEKRLKEKLEILWHLRQKQISKVFNSELWLDFEQEYCRLLEQGKELKSYFAYTNEIIGELISDKVNILLESSQATFLDNSFGTYPYTVAYQTLIQNCFPSIGIPANKISILGVMKCYMIRVGNGPFPTELFDEKANYIRVKGNEFGSVSKRPRRCGWLDLVLIEHSIKLNGVNEIAITNVDALAGVETVQVCTSYKLNNRPVCTNEALLYLDDVTLEYQSFKGWPELAEHYDNVEQLPNELIEYLCFIQSRVNVDISHISYGPDRSQTIEVRTKLLKCNFSLLEEMLV
ncbi:adenylosuccinate synthetase [Shewanella psychropiezotolerans]|uniref:Adenylosuccinate synthetase n=1 Tax=Shewanella psychropiezotolerans TaxID=2593655 RepID=A0ABX5X0C9_9GAMM|nr:adenylosuccinate synthetase [Shewanella psychropiezotolerans]QDO84803.1 adenylosuccinate synthetase [Shewanella psychropiezotolerans]